eukprot:gene20999-21751_t
MNISIDMPEFVVNSESPVIDSMLRKLLVRETLDGENKWFCEKCNEKVAAAKFITFQSLAPALVIQLKRFRYDPTVNIDDNTSAIQNSETFGQYELTGFILHTGTAMGGHYRAYIRSPSDGQWRDFNDSTVTEIEIDKNSPLWSIKSKNSIDTHEEALNHIDSY